MYQGSTLLPLPSPMTHGHSHHPTIGADDWENLPSSSRGTRNTVLGTPQNKARLLEETRHSVGDPCYNFSPAYTYEQYGRMTERHGCKPVIPVDPEPDHSGHRGSLDTSPNGCRIPISYKPGSTGPTQAHDVPFLPGTYASTSANGPHQNGMIFGGDAPTPYNLHYDILGSVSLGVSPGPETPILM